MNKSKLTLAVLLPALVILLMACNASTEREWIIENQSSTGIEFTLKKHLYPYTMQGNLDVGEKRIVEISIEDKASLDPQIPYDVFSEMQITNTEGEIMKKEWQDNTNWDIFIEETTTRPSKQLQSYKLVVRDEDF